ncbi:MAG: hypothetical protein IPN46_20920 [Saprospiraceae bacterium]|nr:hypothetical protein [Saprospiraceae bacterium]
MVSDYIPAGYTFVANNGWTGSCTNDYKNHSRSIGHLVQVQL